VLASPVAQCLDRGDYFGDYLGDTERVTVTVNIRKSQANHTYQPSTKRNNTQDKTDKNTRTNQQNRLVRVTR
jgi:hypothetical protein